MRVTTRLGSLRSAAQLEYRPPKCGSSMPLAEGWRPIPLLVAEHTDSVLERQGMTYSGFDA